jgi:hypothetical protein
MNNYGIENVQVSIVGDGVKLHIIPAFKFKTAV